MVDRRTHDRLPVLSSSDARLQIDSQFHSVIIVLARLPLQKLLEQLLALGRAIGPDIGTRGALAGQGLIELIARCRRRRLRLAIRVSHSSAPANRLRDPRGDSRRGLSSRAICDDVAAFAARRSRRKNTLTKLAIRWPQSLFLRATAGDQHRARRNDGEHHRGGHLDHAGMAIAIPRQAPATLRPAAATETAPSASGSRRLTAALPGARRLARPGMSAVVAASCARLPFFQRIALPVPLEFLRVQPEAARNLAAERQPAAADVEGSILLPSSYRSEVMPKSARQTTCAASTLNSFEM